MATDHILQDDRPRYTGPVLYELVYSCRQCGTQFESGVADMSRQGALRCPQCGLSEARPIKRNEQEEPAIIRKSMFRRS